MASAPQHAQASLPALPTYMQNEKDFASHLASRFHVSEPTARLSSQAIININTFTTSSHGPNGAKEGSAMGAAEELASRVWTRLGARQEDQAVVFLGESGSGKTTIRAHLLASLLGYTSTPLSKKLSYASFVFDAFTTTKSATTLTASKAGLFFELQYDTSATMHPTLIGGKLLDHRLERSRVATIPAGERSFHVLYYLLAGTSAAEKEHLGLNLAGVGGTAGNRQSMVSSKRWRYLGHPSQLKVGIDDAEAFTHMKTALRKLEFPREDIARMCELLAAILHIGQLEFTVTQSTTPAPDESGGYSHEGGEDVTTVKNKDTLDIVAAFLGVSEKALEESLGYRTKHLNRERVTVMLDPKGARDNADELARTLYSLLVAFVVERINQKICAVEDTIGNTVSIVDFPGFAASSSTGSTLDQLLNNAATESLYHFCLQSFFERKSDLLETEEVQVPASSYFDNSDAVKCLLKPGNGLLSILDDQMRRGKSDLQFLESIRKRFDGKNPAIDVGSATSVVPGSNFATRNASAAFTVKHFAGEVDYPVEGLLEANGDVISGDLMNLMNSTTNTFISELFGQDALNKVTHPKERSAIVQASVSSKPSRMPSMAKRRGDRPRLIGRRGADDDEDGFDTSDRVVSRSGKQDGWQNHGAAAQFMASLEAINKSLTAQSTNPYFVFCIKPNDRRIANQFDSRCVAAQLQTLGVVEISQRLRNADFSIFLPFTEFLGLAEGETVIIGSDREKAESIIEEKSWPGNEARVGTTGVFLSERCWRQVAKIGDLGPAPFVDESPYIDANGMPYTDAKSNLLSPHAASPGFYSDEKPASYFGSREVDAKSDAGGSAFHSGDMFRNLETRQELAVKGNDSKMAAIEELPKSGSRKRWLAVVWLITWWVPDFLIRLVGRMPRKDVRTAWREKLAINMLIWFSCLLVVFVMVGFPMLICPTQHVFSSQELTTHNGKDGASAYTSIRGVVLDLGSFIPSHYPGASIIPQSALLKYAGKDATNLFPVQVSALCQTTSGNGTIDPAVQLNYLSSNYTGLSAVTSKSDPNAQYHDFRWWTNDSRPAWFGEHMLEMKSNFYKGNVGYSPGYLKTLSSTGNSISYVDGKVYDFTEYIAGGRATKYPDGVVAPAPGPDTNFMDDDLIQIFQQKPGQDVTADFDRLYPLNSVARSRALTCMNNLFYVGQLDTRRSVKCEFATYFLLAISLLLVSVIGFKFFAALQFGRKNMPENLDKFVICTVPAYTEDEDSLRRAIDSAARMRYDDKRKLLFIVCDGMIIGQGNDRPTPRIVLDILGVPDTVDPEPLSFESLGEGQKQHNMGKIYSGLYEVQGHIVPFLVVVKVGKPSEVSRPGNRGKRDSQMILMRFLNRVHYNLPMTPMELEMHHHIRNIIGVNPTFYEFLLQIDADTVVAPDSATRMIAAFLHDTRLIGVCGETALTNAKSSLTTMMQVYEYYISHNLTKAFESLFGSVTCLPGCFSMYRVRAADTGKPLFVSKEVVHDYSEIRVDTLHMKNLLHLGEDRYLTTLLMKHHSKYKTKYIFRAHAWTIAPDSWTVFLSQRRRWINSTVHNLIELMPLGQLCGFCCFSMRFVVFLDLLSTIVQPVIVGYIVYLIVRIARDPSVVPVTAFILLGAIYGLQAIIFILRRKWEMIGWMIIYILATPVFAMALPLYAFWHMDDFSWGNTRLVTGEKGQQIVVSDEGKFDPNSIPRKKWEDYQAELWDAQTQRDDQSVVSGVTYASKSYHPGTGSVYEMPATRSMTQLSVPFLPHSASRQSLSPSESGMIRQSSAMDLDMSQMMGMPSDDQLLAEIRDILSVADLMTITKKGVKNELERRFGMNLDPKRAYIGSAVEAVLSGNL
ncbi:hypothetical protein ANO11243_026640 [Dothideomycetidae sp. 11243]|nr:hypothetical protein ANO11243_026640 [fungal sp. No.11243]